MECSHCKEEIKKKAKKCKHCGELLGWRGKWNGFSGFVAGSLSVVVSLASLGIAYVEYQGRVEAVEQKEVAEVEKQAAKDILQKQPAENIQRAVEKEIKLQPSSPGFNYLKQGELEKAAEEFKKVLDQNPKNKTARKGLIFAETLLQKEQDK